jgi:hypothetical protein
VDTEGIEDPKLFVWPGKGVFAVFGRKPEALGASRHCRDPVFMQFIVQVGGAGRPSRVCLPQSRCAPGNAGAARA